MMTRQNKKSCWSLFVASLIATGLVCMIFDAFKWEPETYEVSHYDVRLNNWSPAHNGLRIAVLSDIHQKNLPEDISRLRRIIKTTNEQKPHIILLLGDFLGSMQDWQRHNATPKQIANELKDLHAPYGVYAVLGNHDWWINGNAMLKSLERVGIHVLENEVETLLINHAPLNIIGLPDYGTRNAHFDAAVLPDPCVPALTMTHDPDLFKAHDLPYELLFSGHTHGGQVKIPVMGAVTTSSPLMSRFTEGLFRLGERQLIVTRGLGTSLVKMRFLCLPEIEIVTVRQKGPEGDTDAAIPETDVSED